MTKPMNTIEKLIAELCPKGVEFKELGKICKVLRGKRLTKRELSNEYQYPVFHGGLIPLGYYDKYNRKANQTMVINTGSVGEVVWSPVDFWSSDGTFTIETSNEIDDRFVYFILKCQETYLKSQKREGGVPTIDREAVEKILIPIPSLAIQQEIVRILDTFTTLEAELEAELEARRKQYEYYREELLTFGEEVEFQELGVIIISLKTGLNPRKNFVLNTPDAKNYYVTVRELNGIGVSFYKKTDMVNDDGLRLINNRSNLEEGDVLFSGTGTIGRTAWVKEKPNNWNIKEGVYVIKPNKQVINSKYLLYYLNSKHAKTQIENKIVGSPVCSIPMSEMKKIKIPLPCMEEQQRIVSILDKFDALVNDISVGLPAELNARRKQYEYYRGKLLTFEKYAKQ